MKKLSGDIGYKLSPNEVERLLKEEQGRLRKLRLLQVRDLCKTNAANIRKAVKEEQQKRLKKIADKIKQDWTEKKQERIAELRNNYVDAVSDVGKAHQNAIEEDVEGKSLRKQIESELAAQRADIRFSEAILEHRHLAQLNKDEQNKAIQARKLALEVEQERSKQVASRPPPPTDPIEAINLPHSKPVKFTDVDALWTSHYQPTSIVELASSAQIGDAVKDADVESDYMSDIERRKKLLIIERRERARLRYKKALEQELLKNDYDKMLHDLSDLRRDDMQRRQKIVADIPKQIFLPPNQRLEAKREKQLGLEHEFETMYMETTDKVGDITLALDQPVNLGADSETESKSSVTDSCVETGSKSSVHVESKAVKNDLLVGMKSSPASERVLHDITNTAPPLKPKPTTNKSEGVLKKLLKRIHNQRRDWEASSCRYSQQLNAEKPDRDLSDQTNDQVEQQESGKNNQPADLSNKVLSPSIRIAKPVHTAIGSEIPVVVPVPQENVPGTSALSNHTGLLHPVEVASRLRNTDLQADLAPFLPNGGASSLETENKILQEKQSALKKQLNEQRKELELKIVEIEQRRKLLESKIYTPHYLDEDRDGSASTILLDTDSSIQLTSDVDQTSSDQSTMFEKSTKLDVNIQHLNSNTTTDNSSFRHSFSRTPRGEVDTTRIKKYQEEVLKRHTQKPSDKEFISWKNMDPSRVQNTVDRMETVSTGENSRSLWRDELSRYSQHSTKIPELTSNSMTSEPSQFYSLSKDSSSLPNSLNETLYKSIHNLGLSGSELAPHQHSNYLSHLNNTSTQLPSNNSSHESAQSTKSSQLSDIKNILNNSVSDLYRAPINDAKPKLEDEVTFPQPSSQPIFQQSNILHTDLTELGQNVKSLSYQHSYTSRSNDQSLFNPSLDSNNTLLSSSDLIKPPTISKKMTETSNYPNQSSESLPQFTHNNQLTNWPVSRHVSTSVPTTSQYQPTSDQFIQSTETPQFSFDINQLLKNLQLDTAKHPDFTDGKTDSLKNKTSDEILTQYSNSLSELCSPKSSLNELSQYSSSAAIDLSQHSNKSISLKEQTEVENQYGSQLDSNLISLSPDNLPVGPVNLDAVVETIRPLRGEQKSTPDFHHQLLSDEEISNSDESKISAIISQHSNSFSDFLLNRNSSPSAFSKYLNSIGFDISQHTDNSKSLDELTNIEYPTRSQLASNTVSSSPENLVEFPASEVIEIIKPVQSKHQSIPVRYNVSIDDDISFSESKSSTIVSKPPNTFPDSSVKVNSLSDELSQVPSLSAFNQSLPEARAGREKPTSSNLDSNPVHLSSDIIEKPTVLDNLIDFSSDYLSYPETVDGSNTERNNDVESKTSLATISTQSDPFSKLSFNKTSPKDELTQISDQQTEPYQYFNSQNEDTQQSNSLNNIITQFTNSQNKPTQHTIPQNEFSQHINSQHELTQHTNSDNELTQYTNSQNELSQHINSENELTQHTNSQNELTQYTNSQNELTQHTNSQNELTQHTNSQNELTQFPNLSQSELTECFNSQNEFSQHSNSQNELTQYTNLSIFDVSQNPDKQKSNDLEEIPNSSHSIIDFNPISQSSSNSMKQPSVENTTQGWNNESSNKDSQTSESEAQGSNIPKIDNFVESLKSFLPELKIKSPIPHADCPISPILSRPMSPSIATVGIHPPIFTKEKGSADDIIAKQMQDMTLSNDNVIRESEKKMQGMGSGGGGLLALTSGTNSHFSTDSQINTEQSEETGITDEPDLTLINSTLTEDDDLPTNISRHNNSSVLSEHTNSLMSFEYHEQLLGSSKSSESTTKDQTSSFTEPSSALTPATVDLQSLSTLANNNQSQSTLTNNNQSQSTLANNNQSQSTLANNNDSNLNIQTDNSGASFLHVENPETEAVKPLGGLDVPIKSACDEIELNLSAIPQSSQSTAEEEVLFTKVKGVSLQEAFALKKQKFIKNVSDRQSKVREARQNEGNQPLSKMLANWKEKRAFKQPNKEETKKKVNDLTNIKTSSTKDRKLQEKDMKIRTSRLYNQLEEVKEHKKLKEQSEQYAKNREKAKQFQKKLDQHNKKKKS